ncbi:energy transducer TonB [Thalassotalea sp. PLHSN55]|uniref:energy transducer TonB n=1 Tax=Thalassotalea sp. PLHSN55 TaxID=3435888 RepID=UPI003F8324CE
MMTTDNFDKNIKQLYQQRKAQLHAPDIKLADSYSTKKDHSWSSRIAILMIGGVASFGIMALVSHFATLPDATKKPTTEVHQPIEIAEVVIAKPTEDAIVVVPKLPPTPPPPTSPPSQQSLSNGAEQINVSAEHFTFNLDEAHVVVLPDIKQVNMAPKLIHKVAPIYPVNAIKNRRFGSIKLSYKIDDLGKVDNIAVVESKVNKQLEKAAIKALAQWQYQESVSSSEVHHVVFDFQLPKVKG